MNLVEGEASRSSFFKWRRFGHPFFRHSYKKFLGCLKAKLFVSNEYRRRIIDFYMWKWQWLFYRCPVVARSLKYRGKVFRLNKQQLRFHYMPINSMYIVNSKKQHSRAHTMFWKGNCTIFGKLQLLCLFLWWYMSRLIEYQLSSLNQKLSYKNTSIWVNCLKNQI